MKELSIEEKAKAYDEAKLRMSAAYNSNRCTIGFMNEIFPELRESDDERIRKEILEYFQQFDNKELRGVDISDWIAWLENTQYAIDHAKREGFQLGYKAGIEKQGEQKPTEEYNITGIKSKHAQGKLGEMIKKLKPVNEVLEQKPTWTQEDEMMLFSVIWHLRDSVNNGDQSNPAGKLEPWIRTLKERVYAKPKQEWSEWNRILQDASISYLCNLRDEFETKGWDREQIQKCINWLQSLRPQSQWKPSDEQMEALKGVQEGVFRLGILESLYNDLLKLK